MPPARFRPPRGRDLTGVADVVVAGQIARDLVLVVGDVPGPGGSAPVSQRREMLGGKGANQAVALAQLGVAPALVGVVGADETGQKLLAQAERDGIAVAGVVRRPETRTGLIVDVVDSGGQWRYLEDLPEPVLLTEADVQAAAGLLPGMGCPSTRFLPVVKSTTPVLCILVCNRAVPAALVFPVRTLLYRDAALMPPANTPPPLLFVTVQWIK